MKLVQQNCVNIFVITAIHDRSVRAIGERSQVECTSEGPANRRQDVYFIGCFVHKTYVDRSCRRDPGTMHDHCLRILQRQIHRFIGLCIF